jgi:hydrogenase nickel incorporation protein HypA/HybF
VHELGLITQILELAAEVAAELAPGGRVRRIVLEVGALACVSRDALGFAFEVAREGTCADEAVLDIVAVPGEDLVVRAMEVD